jgi:membrane-bound lytic murein transglycosylase D
MPKPEVQHPLHTPATRKAYEARPGPCWRPSSRMALVTGLCLLLAACQTPPERPDAQKESSRHVATQPGTQPIKQNLDTPVHPSVGQSLGQNGAHPPGDPVIKPLPLSLPPAPPSAALIPEAPGAQDGVAPASTLASAHFAVQPGPPPRDDLWGRIRQGLAIPPLALGEAAQRQAQHMRWYERNGEHMRRVFRRARLYMFDIVEAVQAAGLPMEVALLPAVESAFMPDAVSSAAADGLWQFIDSTGKHYGLQQHAFMDQRRDVRQATRAALAFLKELQGRYGGDMQLALAAYNCGPGCIDAAVRRARAKGLDGRFEDLTLNPETSNYVPRLLALAALVAQALDTETLDRHHLPDMPNAPYFTEVLIARDLDVALAARLAGQSEAEFRSLNPQHKKPVIVAQINPHVLVPLDRKESFEEALQTYRGQMSSWTTHRVQERSSVQAIAQRVGIDPERLRRLNGIPAGHVVKAGSTLLVPRRGADVHDIAASTAEAASVGTTPATATKRPRPAQGGKHKPTGKNHREGRPQVKAKTPSPERGLIKAPTRVRI